MKKVTKEAGEAGRVAIQARISARMADISPIIAELRQAGITSLHGLANGLTQRGIPTARGGTKWQAVQVSRVLDQLAVDSNESRVAGKRAIYPALHESR